MDLSSPHGSHIPSINHFSMQYATIDHAITLIRIWHAMELGFLKQTSPAHSKSCPSIQTSGISSEFAGNEQLFFLPLTFGCKSSPKIFDFLSKALCWILTNNHKLPHIFHLLDNFLLVTPKSSPPLFGPQNRISTPKQSFRFRPQPTNATAGTAHKCITRCHPQQPHPKHSPSLPNKLELLQGISLLIPATVSQQFHHPCAHHSEIRSSTIQTSLAGINFFIKLVTSLLFLLPPISTSLCYSNAYKNRNLLSQQNPCHSLLTFSDSASLHFDQATYLLWLTLP